MTNDERAHTLRRLGGPDLTRERIDKIESTLEQTASALLEHLKESNADLRLHTIAMDRIGRAAAESNALKLRVAALEKLTTELQHQLSARTEPERLSWLSRFLRLRLRP
jgi:hypothetical protein